jgi:Tol biopolymer transport system component
MQRLTWFDRSGRELGEFGPVGRFAWIFELSPDDKRVAFSFAPLGEVNYDIWVLDVDRDVAIRLTSDPCTKIWPVWSHDGSTIFYESLQRDRHHIWMRPATGIGEARELPGAPGEMGPQAVTPDGRFLLGYHVPSGGQREIIQVSLDANPRTTLLGIRGFHLSLSRDGRWLAYSSGESGRREVYVVDFPGLTGKWRVSIGGGELPRWSADGRELFFMAPGGEVMSAPITTVPAFRVGRPVRILGAFERGWFEPASDGKRFLSAMDLKGEPLPPTKVVVNWLSAVRRR